MRTLVVPAYLLALAAAPLSGGDAAAVADMRYAAQATRTGWLEDGLWRARGTVWNAGHRTRIRGAVTTPDGETRALSAERDGERWLFVDHSAGTWTGSDHADAGGAAASVLAGLATPALAAAGAEECAARPDAERLGSTPCRVLDCERGGARTTLYVDAAEGWPLLARTRIPLGGSDHAVERVTVRDPRPLAQPLDEVRQAPAGFREVSPAPRPTPLAETSRAVTSLADSLAPLAVWFDGARGTPRWVGLFAPS